MFINACKCWLDYYFLLLWVKFNPNFARELKVVVIFANPNLQKKSKAKKKENTGDSSSFGKSANR